ncbi:hypothetical protein Dsin_011092 [Dipteronia sinensis]|uniref:Reverse transcriptase n=1 Tax=Dipteronia sinensis TaxID=43782 RepID=A0AAE0AUY2_9ROSI|nr:hypothetical protein Dsin_011092 [Dipteronia sinensis]
MEKDRDEAISRKWNLEGEITKVIEKRVALGVDMNQRNEESTDDVEGQNGFKKQWNLDVEVTKIIESGVALGVDFNGKEEEMTKVLTTRDMEEDENCRTRLDGSIGKDLNKTFIVLIEKCGKPKTKKDFRPISLVGSIYKVLAKVGKKGLAEGGWAEAFRCKKESLLISYLGLLLRARPRSKAFWKLLLTRTENRLTPCKRKFLNKGGRLTSIKTVLSSVPSYFLLVFKLPNVVAYAIKKFQMSFFWGDGVEKKKYHVMD